MRLGSGLVLGQVEGRKIRLVVYRDTGSDLSTTDKGPFQPPLRKLEGRFVRILKELREREEKGPNSH